MSVDIMSYTHPSNLDPPRLHKKIVKHRVIDRGKDISVGGGRDIAAFLKILMRP